MEFGEGPPPFDDECCPSVLGKKLWTLIETEKINYAEDYHGWCHKFRSEMETIETFAKTKDEAARKWMEDTDFAIRMLRCVKIDELSAFYMEQLAAQGLYMEKLDKRRKCLADYIDKFTILMAEETRNKKTDEKPKKQTNKQKHGNKNSKKSNRKKCYR
ncbi:hypothetical protein GCK72_006155 [Caenorhabditis remanei]|uniref:Uncharacterized protein n=1 Tax=Caenorhabditis remanei TaxID=31234 RepID=A0A6A5HG32_CAERE|nr:hypothetical protein GCK72_006155 [Caenorhabditis remanei]KAF1766199.1 hypothetical protein GCK72_006155 [Caenorhabditis remanei]